jgi:Ankyrin repeats (3 copies)/BTB/POZ domain
MPRRPEDPDPDPAGGGIGAAGAEESDDNPWPVHLACRRGDLQEVKRLVSVLHHSVNESDDFNATPLYLAALCGHADMCEFLLRNGAKCEGGEAARVFYVALTSDLRDLLRKWSLSASTSTSNYEPFLHVLFHVMTRDAARSDCCVRAPTRPEGKMYLHKVLLRELCPRLLEYCLTPDDDGNEPICIPTRFVLENGSEDALAAMLIEYLYTGCCELRGSADQATRLAALAADLDLDELRCELLEALSEFEQSSLEIQEAEQQEQGQPDFACSIAHNSKAKLEGLAHRVTSPTVHSIAVVEFTDMTITWSSPEQDPAATSPRKWCVHAGILAAHSDYFACAVQGAFREAEQATIDLSHMVPFDEVIDLALQWMYCGSFLATPSCTDPTLDIAVALVEFASAVLCPNLCQFAAQTLIVPALTIDTVFDMLDLARAYNLERLEDRCVNVIALSLPVLAQSEEMHRVLRDEIRQTSQRGDVRVLDVPLAAEIRSILRRLPPALATLTDDGRSAETYESKTELFALLDEALRHAIAAEERSSQHLERIANSRTRIDQ